MVSNGSDSDESPHASRYRSLEEVLAAALYVAEDTDAASRQDEEQQLSTSLKVAPESSSVTAMAAVSDGKRQSSPSLQAEQRADRLREQLHMRDVQQANINSFIAEFGPRAQDRREKLVVDLSAEALRNSKYPYVRYSDYVRAQAGGGIFPEMGDTSPSPWFNAKAREHSSMQHKYAHNEGPLVRPSTAATSSNAGLSDSRYAHYAQELRVFYEVLFEVELDDTTLPSGATKPHGSHWEPHEYALRRRLAEEKISHIPTLLTKFRGYEEDLFRLLKAKYNAPVYRFVHYE